MKLIYRWLNKTDQWLAYLAAAAIFVMMIWVCLDVILRALINRPIVGTMEFTGEYLMVIITYFAISFTFKENGHVSVDLFMHKFSKGTKKIFGLISNLVACYIFIIVGYSNFIEALEFFEKDIRSASLLKYPLGPALIIISFGIFLLSIRLLIDSILLMFNKRQS